MSPLYIVNPEPGTPILWHRENWKSSPIALILKPVANEKDEPSITEFESLADYAKELEKSGTLPAPPPADGEVMQLEKIEQIDNFESLDEFAKHSPLAEPDMAIAPPQESQSSPDLFPVQDSSPPSALEGLSGLNEPALGNLDPSNPSMDFQAPSETLSGLPSFGSPGAEGGMLADDAGFAPEHQEMTGLSDARTGILGNSPLGFDEPAPNAPVEPPPLADFHEPSLDPAPQTMRANPPPFPPQPVPGGMDRLRQYSEGIAQSRTPVAAQYPFSLMIEGRLEADESARLIDLLGREGFGISEVDLEPQLKSGRILIPRISEYAGVLLVQALRTAKATIRLGPSDTIFATDATRAEADEVASALSATIANVQSDSPEAEHPAERIPVTTDVDLPGFGPYYVLDALTGAASMRTFALEAENSNEYQIILENLKRELQYKAYRRGANGLINFTVQVVPLSERSHYRIIAVASAIRSGQPKYPEPGPLPVRASRDQTPPPPARSRPAAPTVARTAPPPPARPKPLSSEIEELISKARAPAPFDINQLPPPYESQAMPKGPVVDDLPPLPGPALDPIDPMGLSVTPPPVPTLDQQASDVSDLMSIPEPGMITPPPPLSPEVDSLVTSAREGTLDPLAELTLPDPHTGEMADIPPPSFAGTGGGAGSETPPLVAELPPEFTLTLDDETDGGSKGSKKN